MAAPADTSVHWNLGGATGMFGSYRQNKSDKLTNGLDSTVFEDYKYDSTGAPFVDSVAMNSSPYVYIQRSFVNPAESPKVNGREIGMRTWKGANGCKKRRSLFEEAQEVRAGGQNVLDSLRSSPFANYRTVPSRNIIIAHSMGGVSSREYVQGGSLYKEDVER